MRSVVPADSRPPRTSSIKRLSIHVEDVQEYRTATPTTNRPSSALKSTGHRLIHDDSVTTEPNEVRGPSPNAATLKQTHSRLSGRFQPLDTGMSASKDEFAMISPRMNHPPPLSPQFSGRFRLQDNELTTDTKTESPTRNSNSSRRPSFVTQRSGRLQIHDPSMAINTQEIPIVSPIRSRPTSPSLDRNEHLQRTNNDAPVKKQEIPVRIIPRSPIRQLSERITLHDKGALGSRKEISLKVVIPSMPMRQQGEGGDSKRDLSVGVAKAPVTISPEATDSQHPENQSVNHLNDQQVETRPILASHEDASDISAILSSAIAEQMPTSSFVPLPSQWSYGQRIFGRYKKTPYFYSGNIATYLGSGLFMVVFDDGTLDYRVRREDIMLRETLQVTTASQKQRRQPDPNAENAKALRLDSFSGYDVDSSTTAKDPKKNLLQDQETDDEGSDPSINPELFLLPSQHVMVDFSVDPPREIVLSFDDSSSYYDVRPPCGTCSLDSENWRLVIEDEALTMKQLECGVAYEDDSTQVSDSGESSEEDMSMTPWQQMTQTFGMGKANRPQRNTGRRRSSVSSVSQIDRLSLTNKGMTQIIPTPKSLKQVIVDYFMRSNKKVQPSKLTDEIALVEQIRLMEAKLNGLRSVRCTSGSFTAKFVSGRDSDSLRVVYERPPDGIRTYGTVKNQGEDGDYAVVTEDEQSISVQLIPKEQVDFLPSVWELEQQLIDLEKSQRVLFAGQKVHVSLYPGSRFSGRGLITLEKDHQSRFHVLLSNRIRLVNVPADKISPLREKKKAAVTITEDQFLMCSNKVKVYIGDQIYVKCLAGESDLDCNSEEKKLGLLNGVYSNKTAAVDFADGSTGYEVPPHLIFKRKRASVPADQDVRSLKNAVLMQASAAANGGTEGNLPVLEEGYQVKADHPRKTTVESCIVIKTHASSACDLRFSDGTIVFEVFPSQMILDSVEQLRTQTRASTLITPANNRMSPKFAVGDYVLAWSSRFGRYCSAKIIEKSLQATITTSGVTSSPSVRSISSTDTMSSQSISPALVPTTLFTLVFDYGEKKARIPADKITRLDDTCALSHSQRLTNVSIDTLGFELSPVNFNVGEAVMARVHGTARYFNGIIEAVNDKERVCEVCFDSSERDLSVPFSAMFTVDFRLRSTGRSSSTKQVGGGGGSSSAAASRSRLLSHHRAPEETTASETSTRQRRHSSTSASVSNVIKSMDSFFRGSRAKANPKQRRGSNMITEIGARVRLSKQ